MWGVLALNILGTTVSSDTTVSTGGGGRGVYQLVGGTSIFPCTTPFGFMCWRIHEGNIDHNDFFLFLNEEVSPHIVPFHHLVLESATIRRAPETTISLEETTTVTCQSTAKLDFQVYSMQSVQR